MLLGVFNVTLALTLPNYEFAPDFKYERMLSDTPRLLLY